MMYIIQLHNNEETKYLSILSWGNAEFPNLVSLPDYAYHFKTMEEAHKKELEICQTGKFPGYIYSVISVDTDSLQNIIDAYGEINPDNFDMIDFTKYIETSLDNKYDIISIALEDTEPHDLITTVLSICVDKQITANNVKLGYATVFYEEDLCIIAIKKEE